MWKIPLFDISFDQEEVEAAQKVIRSGWLTMGESTKEFEKVFSGFLGVKHAIAVSSGTAALHLAHCVLGIGNGDEVVCPSFTFVAGANSIIYTGAKPVFAEVTSAADLNISPENIKDKITEKTKAIQVVHYAGYPCNMDSINDIAEQYRLHVIEDCAHAIGAVYKNRKCGTIGDIGCFSFFSNKNMTTAEGGMITTNNDEFARRIRLMRSHGMTTSTLDRHKGHAFNYDVVEFGFNYRIDEIRSAIGIAQLRKLQDGNIRRKEITRLYRERFAGIKKITIPFSNDPGISSYHLFPILLDRGSNRVEFMEFLSDKGIQTSIHYSPVHRFDFYRRNFGYDDGMLPVTEDVAGREVTLPLYPSMKDEDVNYVCNMVYEFSSLQ